MWLLGSVCRCVPSPVCGIQRRWSSFCAVVIMRLWYIIIIRGCTGFSIVGLQVPPPAGGVWLMLWCAWLRRCKSLCSRCQVPSDVGFLAPFSGVCCICELMGHCVSIMCVVGSSRVGIWLIEYLQFWWVLV
jgi:hypothetical protein